MLFLVIPDYVNNLVQLFTTLTPGIFSNNNKQLA